MRLYCIITSGTFCGASTRSDAAPARTARRVIAGSNVIHRSRTPTAATTNAEITQMRLAYAGADLTHSRTDCSTSQAFAVMTLAAHVHALTFTHGLLTNTPMRAGLLVK